MKNTIVFCTLILAFAACKKEEECIAPAISTNIVGKWDGSLSFLGQSSSGQIEFLADGTLLDPDCFIICGGINEEDFEDKTWELLADGTTIKFKASGSNGSTSGEANVKSNECNEIVLSFDGLVDAKLKRN